ncbi:MAG: hypothetical protein R2883_06285 [Caldisericia bacterium]
MLLFRCSPKMNMVYRASIIGRATEDHKRKTYLITEIGGSRILEPPAGELLPRIC